MSHSQTAFFFLRKKIFYENVLKKVFNGLNKPQTQRTLGHNYTLIEKSTMKKKFFAFCFFFFS